MLLHAKLQVFPTSEVKQSIHCYQTKCLVNTTWVFMSRQIQILRLSLWLPTGLLSNTWIVFFWLLFSNLFFH